MIRFRRAKAATAKTSTDRLACCKTGRIRHAHLILGGESQLSGDSRPIELRSFLGNVLPVGHNTTAVSAPKPAGPRLTAKMEVT